MRYLLAILFLTYTTKPDVEVVKVIEPKIEAHITHFPSVYKQIREHEGNYVYHKFDKGGETYGGITRKYNPDWYGWRYIHKGLNTNEIVCEAEFWVKDAYLDIWVKEGYMDIKDYNLALNLFDLRINSSPRTYEKKVNKVLKDMNECDIYTLSNTEEFVWRLKIERILLYSYLAMNDSTQRTFYKGWIRRLDI